MISSQLVGLASFLDTVTEGPIAFDIETTGLNPRAEKLVTMQFLQTGRLPFTLDARTYNTPTELVKVRDIIAPLFDGKHLIIGHNLKFDFSWLLVKFGIRPMRLYDTMLADQVIYAGEEHKGYGLKDVAERRGVRLDAPMDKTLREWFFHADADTQKWTSPFPDSLVLYMQTDVEVLHPIFKSQVKDLKEKRLMQTAQLEFSVLPATIEIEVNGMHIDRVAWMTFMDKKEQEADTLKDALVAELGPVILKRRAEKWDAAIWRRNTWMIDRDAAIAQAKVNHTDLHLTTPWGEYKTVYMQAWREAHPNPGPPKGDSEINVDSQAQLLEAFTLLGIPITSTNEKVLKELAGSYPSIQHLRTYRKAQKFVTSYGESLLNDEKIYCPIDERYHFSYGQCGAATGRYTASRIQQIPSRGEGKVLRRCFQATEGNMLITCDYSAIEMRILAEVSKDDQLIFAFNQGQDIHSAIAVRIFGLDEETDPKTSYMQDQQGNTLGTTYRDGSKHAEYATVYGTGPNTLAGVMEVPVAVARETMAAFAEEYGRVSAYLNLQHRNVLVTEESRTIGGRARYFHVPKMPPLSASREEKEQYRMIIGGIQRSAANAAIQGTSADITKSALAILIKMMRDRACFHHIKIVACVHDEIVLEVPEIFAEEAGKMLKSAMDMGATKYLKAVSVDCEYTISKSWEH